MKNKTTAALLSFFLGGFGAQHFYLRKTGKGILSILFFWTFIPAIIAIVNFIQFLTMEQKDFDIKYNNGRPSMGVVNTADELEKLYSLKEKGVLTQQEFDKRKAELI